MKQRFVGLHVDFIGFVASFLCAIHCASLPLLLSLTPLLGLKLLENPFLEYAMILLSSIIASYALIKGYARYHKKLLALVIVLFGFLLIALGRFLETETLEITFTSTGAIAISTAHFINWKCTQSLLDN